MEIKCEYCGALIPDDSPHCPNCGAVNSNLRRAAEGIPKTIEELKQWYKDHNLPPYKTTRFFIGEDYKGAKAFGIYKDGEKFIVYKNKADGSRAIRYEGTDEDYAVNELYLKLKSEIINQKEHNTAENRKTETSYTSYTPYTYRNNKKKMPHVWVIIVTIFAIVMILSRCQLNNCSHSGYYYIPNYSNSSSYDSNQSYDDNYSYYNDYNSNHNDYSNYFDTWDSDWDSGSSWDSGDSWDSGWSDWDSDW